MSTSTGFAAGAALTMHAIGSAHNIPPIALGLIIVFSASLIVFLVSLGGEDEGDVRIARWAGSVLVASIVSMAALLWFSRTPVCVSGEPIPERGCVSAERAPHSN